LGLYLFCYPGKKVCSNMPITYNLAFLDADNNFQNNRGNKINAFYCHYLALLTSIPFLTETSFNFNGILGYGCPNFAKHSYAVNPVNKILHHDDQLHIRCKV